MHQNDNSNPFAGLGVTLPAGSADQHSAPRKSSRSPRRRGPVSREVAFYLARAERMSRERSVLEMFVDGMADVAADLHAEGRLPQVQTHDGPLPGRSKP